ncbi:SUMF1/EgtB/PvdO family nonheme iron enzyme [Roseomonas sp. HF4]|uniref:SUMF1/EgtB/PvdO family nonheme iron enzyme n=1 Tax=Roseomonas sp. HF4 TaxID=2562313 RepID=UPI0010C0AB21|nr:SUMF1/EgtB/PvdO family nonheme iron enzyme [Roseomonas sp. HF4]
MPRFPHSALARAVLTLLLIAALHEPALAQQRRVALVVGNGDYRHAPALPNASNDADAVANALRDLGFTVTLERNQPIEGMRAALRHFSDAARGAEVALFFFAGHGLQMAQRDRAENFLVPVDARLADARDLEDETIGLSRVLQLMDGAHARLVILDACRDNPILARIAQTSATRSIRRGLAPIETAEAQGTLIAFSTAPGAVAADGSGGNSPFTLALLRHLPTPGLEIRGALTRVRAEVARETGNSQVPWSNDGLLSELYLAGRAPPTAAASSQVLTPSAAAIELAFWQSIGASRDPADFEEYLRRYPDGNFSGLARNRIALLGPPAPAAIPMGPPAAPMPSATRAPAPPQRAAVAPPAPVAAPAAAAGVAPAPPVPAATRPSAPAPPASQARPGERFRDCPECPEMVVIPPGRFVMGSPASERWREADEGPQREVTLVRPVALGLGPVTVGQFVAFAQATGRRMTAACRRWNMADDSFVPTPALGWTNPGFPQGQDHPVVCVSWHDAQAYARWLSERTGRRYRLPTEAEWEYAARAGTRTAWWWGDDEAAQCRHANGIDQHVLRTVGSPGRYVFAPCSDGFMHTSPVGRFAANGFGLHDMVGNAWQWVQDCHHPSYEGAPATASEAVENRDCALRVLRGGAWTNAPRFLRSADRLRNDPALRFTFVGFRVATAAP